MKKHYDVLGLKLEATSDEVKRAYRDLSKKYHPDLCIAVSKERAEEKFKEINEAYGMIKKYLKRANNNENKKEESVKNDKCKYDVEMIYELVQKYIAETQLKAPSLKFPSNDTLSFFETDSFLMIEGYFFSKNWIEQKVKTSYRVSLFKNFKLNKLDFLNTEIITEKERYSNHKKNTDINDKLKSYAEREKIYRWIKKYIMDMQEKPMSCDFPAMSSLNFYSKDNRIVVEGFFSYPNASAIKVKKEYKVYMNSQYIISKFQVTTDKSKGFKEDNYNEFYQRYRQKKEKKIKGSVVINLNFLKSKFLFLVLIVFLIVIFLIP